MTQPPRERRRAEPPGRARRTRWAAGLMALAGVGLLAFLLASPAPSRGVRSVALAPGVQATPPPARPSRPAPALPATPRRTVGGAAEPSPVSSLTSPVRSPATAAATEPFPPPAPGAAPADSAPPPPPAATAPQPVSPTALPTDYPPAPTFTLADLAGHPVHLQDFRGHPVWINFWATWCAPCRTEMPLIQQMYTRYRDQGLVVLGINQGEDRRTVAIYVRNGEPFTWTFLLDPDGQAARAYELGGLPTHAFIDRAGRLRGYAVGQMSRAAMDTALTRILPAALP